MPAGIAGPAGAAGAAGARWWNAAGVPANGTGVVGDYYLNATTGDVYTKTGTSTWTLSTNIKGATGSQGIQGATGATGSQGIQGATGAQGIQGIQGPQGIPGPNPSFAGAQLTSAGISTGRTGWGISPNSADPSGKLTIGTTGISVVTGGVVFVQFQPTLSTTGSVVFAIVLNDPNTGQVWAQSVYTPSGPGTKIAGMWVLATGSSLHPVFLSSSSGSTCSGGYFEMVYLGPRAI